MPRTNPRKVDARRAQWGQTTWGRATRLPAATPGILLPLVRALLLFAVLAASSTVASDPELFPRVQPQIIEDGHARPRAVTVGKRDGLVYVAATTGNAVYVIDPDRAAVR